MVLWDPTCPLSFLFLGFFSFSSSFSSSLFSCPFYFSCFSPPFSCLFAFILLLHHLFSLFSCLFYPPLSQISDTAPRCVPTGQDSPALPKR